MPELPKTPPSPRSRARSPGSKSGEFHEIEPVLKSHSNSYSSSGTGGQTPRPESRNPNRRTRNPVARKSPCLRSPTRSICTPSPSPARARNQEACCFGTDRQSVLSPHSGHAMSSVGSASRRGAGFSLSHLLTPNQPARGRRAPTTQPEGCALWISRVRPRPARSCQCAARQSALHTPRHRSWGRRLRIRLTHDHYFRMSDSTNPAEFHEIPLLTTTSFD